MFIEIVLDLSWSPSSFIEIAKTNQEPHPQNSEPRRIVDFVRVFD